MGGERGEGAGEENRGWGASASLPASPPSEVGAEGAEARVSTFHYGASAVGLGKGCSEVICAQSRRRGGP